MQLLSWSLFILLLSPSLRAVSNISEGKQFSWEVLFKGDDVIWGFDFMPEGKIIFTERRGQARIFDPKTKQVITLTGLPKVHAQGQGGLLDVCLHPDFKNNHLIYFTYAEALGSGQSTTALGRGRLAGEKLLDFKRLFQVQDAQTTNYHYGSRIVFDHQGHLFMTVGDRGARERVQDLNYHIGKIIRLKADGSVPQDNPFVNKAAAKPEIWSYGHRNPQGLYYRSDSKELWSVEFGPQGGDELHLIAAGKNYGWPVISFGKEYGGGPIGEGKTHQAGMEQPLHYWVPAISPSGMTFYLGDKFPHWRGNIFLANLATQHLRRLVLDGGKVIKEEELLKHLSHRFRQVKAGPDGLLYSSTDEGHLGKISPAE
jgi:aldose sugar dehydrogenase